MRQGPTLQRGQNRTSGGVGVWGRDKGRCCKGFKQAEKEVYPCASLGSLGSSEEAELDKQQGYWGAVYVSI